ncbi:MAG: DNA recombination protein RmuC [Ruminococcaceae bacterium]|nr:DNA recombination protein RmuC [Oscillospiraceae bacterium]
MDLQSILLMVVLVVALAALAVGVVNLVRKPAKPDTADFERRILDEQRQTRGELSQTVREEVRAAAQSQAETQKQLDGRQDIRLKELREQLAASQAALQASVSGQMAAMDKRIGDFSLQNAKNLESVRRTMEERVTAMQRGNEEKLDEMRRIVDEKLQKTLNERLQQSFSLVKDSLDKVQHGLGEMQTLANGVGDLKKVLSNVKTRGILGEIQLGAILNEMLSPEQYGTNVATVKGSAERVEYAVKLPGDGAGEHVWLPIDAKFPSDAYAGLLDAYESADSAAVDAAGKVLDARIRAAAQEIRSKYVHVPETTEFAILFLPVEGLYAEVVRRGLVERLQTDYKVVIAGPTTLAALLNSLQMGFRTLAIQKRSGEVWKVLGNVKSEFAKFLDLLEKTKTHMDRATRNIDELMGTRARQMERKLRSVEGIEAGDLAGPAAQLQLGQPLEDNLGEDDE